MVLEYVTTHVCTCTCLFPSKIEIFDLPEIAQRYASGISLDFTKIERGTTFINSAHSKVYCYNNIMIMSSSL